MLRSRYQDRVARFHFSDDLYLAALLFILGALVAGVILVLLQRIPTAIGTFILGVGDAATIKAVKDHRNKASEEEKAALDDFNKQCGTAASGPLKAASNRLRIVSYVVITLVIIAVMASVLLIDSTLVLVVLAAPLALYFLAIYVFRGLSSSPMGEPAARGVP